ncbi:MAG: DUF1638 domain-containing protein [Ilumatobacteraceae bacterium]
MTELRAVLSADGLEDEVEVRYLPANLHNRPDRIVPALRELLDELDPQADREALIGYADCGTGGRLDALLEERPNLRRLPGDHCYEFFTGTDFAALAEEEIGTFFLTDFLAKHFEAIVWQGLRLDRHPELLPAYFGNYTRLVLLSQTDRDDVLAAGRDAAERLGLRFEHRHTGLDPFDDAVRVTIGKKADR